jgi:thiamine-monophosphate kinase
VRDEDEFTSWVAPLIHPSNLLGHDEDAVAVKMDDGFLVLNIDGWVESTDRPTGMSLYSCGYRAVINAASDIVAKGASPESMIISMSIPKFRSSEIIEIIEGFSKAADEYEIAYLGGDMNTSNDLVIDVTIWGKTSRLVKRSGAQVGEKVYWLGPPLGEMAAALGVLTKDWKGDQDTALEIFSNPELYTDILEYNPTSAIDCSDGLARSLHLLSRKSQVGIELHNLELGSDWARDVSKVNKIKDTDLILYGGEELGIIFTLPETEKRPVGAIALGSITEKIGVHMHSIDIENRGWDHFLETK